MTLLSDFFRVNFPYGIRKNSKNEWVCFNREYMPLGWNSVERKSIHDEEAFAHLRIYTKYNGLTEEKLQKLAHEPDAVRKDNDGKIVMVFFSNDRTNPQSSRQYWNEYFEKIRLLFKCEVKKSCILVKRRGVYLQNL
jgi:hypothetical protein